MCQRCECEEFACVVHAVGSVTWRLHFSPWSCIYEAAMTTYVRQHQLPLAQVVRINTHYLYLSAVWLPVYIVVTV